MTNEMLHNPDLLLTDARIATDDPDLQRVLAALGAGGQQAYVVGGAVRNGLLGAPVADWDISTDAVPERTTELGRAAGLKAVPTGIEHGTVTLVAGGRPFEVTTFRHDVETDGRHAVVAFSRDLRDDAMRRDFTMNALYARADGRVIDPVGGLADLAARRLRFVGPPEQRIREDYLRILRFFRFLAWYGKAEEADPEALAACKALASGLAQISRERVGAELKKLLSAADPVPALTLMARTGVLAAILPEADTAADSDALPLMAALIRAEAQAGIAPDWPRRMALLQIRDPAQELRLSQKEARHLERLALAGTGAMPLAELAYRMGAEVALDHALLRQAQGLDCPDNWRMLVQGATEQKFPLSAADLMPDLSGPQLGQGLKAAEQAWIDSGFAIPKADLIRLARQATI